MLKIRGNGSRGSGNNTHNFFLHARSTEVFITTYIHECVFEHNEFLVKKNKIH